MEELIQGQQATYVVFTKSNHWFFKYFFKRGYSHCYALIWDGYQIICFDKTITNTFINTVESYNGKVLMSPSDIFEYIAQDNDVTQVVCVNADKLRKLYESSNTNFIVSFLRPNSCVEYVKDYLGMNTLKYWTPYKLFKYIT